MFKSTEVVLTAVLLLLLGFSLSVSAQDGDELIKKKYSEEIRELAEYPSIQNAFDFIEENDPKTTEDLIMLTEIPAPPFKEDDRAHKYLEMLRKAGADSVWMDEEGNVIALRKGTEGNETVALGAHLDTVFPEGTDVTVKTKGDTLFAPGVGDDTRGLMVVLTVLRALEEENIQTKEDLLFIGTVGEEGLGDLRGVKHLFSDKGPGIDSWIAIDGGDVGRIVNKGLGSHRYRVTYEGPGGHSWGSFGLVNPAHALGKAMYIFSQKADEFTQKGARTSYNVGRIDGGTSVNSIPFEAWMEVDMRSVSNERLEQIDKIFQQAVSKALDEENDMRRRGPELTVDVEMIGDRPSGEIDPNIPLVQRAMSTTRFFNSDPTLARSSTDSNTPISKNIPAVTIGRGGDGGNSHSLDEWWLNKDGHIAIQRTLLLLVSQAGLHK
ncbi:M20/M25/M40 family metallo-hydrolase [Fodinibius sp. SL11]|uniref:M20/M25/M40 family metallo-hydrolase n=1 Tax=Fodinibius sp. SL11 TaxID=3425690 RepID=UPI003F880B50